jgi:N-acetylneuraminate lyase
VGGSSGEGLLLSPEERKGLAEGVVKEVAGAATVMVHVGATSTDEAAELARHAKRIGADAVGSIPPIYYRVGLQGLADHYRLIGEASDLPLYVYYFPGATGVSVEARDFADRLSRIPTLRGMKFTDYNLFLMRQIQEAFGGKLNVLSGPDEVFVAARMMGADGAIGTTYNLIPQVFIKADRAFRDGDIAAAQDWQFKANRVIAILLRYGHLPAFKAAMGFLGIDCGTVRRPLIPLDEAARSVLRRELEETGFFEW